MNKETRLSRGDYGEALIKNFYKDWSHLGAIQEDGDGDGNLELSPPGTKYHAFDHIFKHNTNDWWMADTKCKARRNKGDTGLDIYQWKKYNRIYNKYKAKGCEDFKLFFVDEHPDEMRIYYVSIKEVQDKLANDPEFNLHSEFCAGKTIVFFKPELWHEVRKLTMDEVENLRRLNDRSYEYN